MFNVVIFKLQSVIHSAVMVDYIGYIQYSKYGSKLKIVCCLQFTARTSVGGA